MADFETHDRGTARELLLLRTMLGAIEGALRDGVQLPLDVERVYKELVAFYETVDYYKG